MTLIKNILLEMAVGDAFGVPYGTVFDIGVTTRDAITRLRSGVDPVLADIAYGWQRIPDDWLESLARKGEIVELCERLGSGGVKKVRRKVDGIGQWRTWPITHMFVCIRTVIIYCKKFQYTVYQLHKKQGTVSAIGIYHDVFIVVYTHRKQTDALPLPHNRMEKPSERKDLFTDEYPGAGCEPDSCADHFPLYYQ